LGDFGFIKHNDAVPPSSAAAPFLLVALPARGQLHRVGAIVIALQQAVERELGAGERAARHGFFSSPPSSNEQSIL